MSNSKICSIATISTFWVILHWGHLIAFVFHLIAFVFHLYNCYTCSLQSLQFLYSQSCWYFWVDLPLRSSLIEVAFHGGHLPSFKISKISFHSSSVDQQLSNSKCYWYQAISSYLGHLPFSPSSMKVFLNHFQYYPYLYYSRPMTVKFSLFPAGLNQNKLRLSCAKLRINWTSLYLNIQMLPSLELVLQLFK